MNPALQDLGEYITDTFLDEIVERQLRLDELTVTVRRDDILEVLKVLRDDANCQFKQLVDVCGVD